jgi:hypothetical protein
VLGVWSRCVETVVVADMAVESYAVSEKDFSGLFLSEADLQTFEEMKIREVSTFKMDESIKCEADAANEFGKPLYICVFSRLDLTIINGRNLAPTGFDGLSDTYVIAEILDSRSGEVISKSFSYRTATIKNSNDPCWMESFQWMDIPGSFDKLILRVSVYDSDFVGLDTFLGKVEVTFPELLRDCMQTYKNGIPQTFQNVSGTYLLQTVPSLNLKDDDLTSRSGRKSSDFYDQHKEPEFPPPNLPGYSSQNTSGRNDSFAENSCNENGENDTSDTARSNNGKSPTLRSSSFSGSYENLLPTPSSLTSPLKFILPDKKTGRKKPNSPKNITELDKLKIGHVQKWFDLKPRSNPQKRNSDPGKKSWNGKIYPVDYQGKKQQTKHYSAHSRAPPGQKPTLEVANVTGSIQLRYHVRRAERELIERAPLPAAPSPMKRRNSLRAKPSFRII